MCRENRWNSVRVIRGDYKSVEINRIIDGKFRRILRQYVETITYAMRK